MKKLVCLLLMVFVMLGLTSCDLLSTNYIYDDHLRCDKLMEKLSTYLMNDDYDNAKSLFAPRLYSFDSFDSDLKELLAYYEGEAKDIRGYVTTGEYSNFDYEEKYHSLEYDVTTDSEVYRYNIVYIEKDSRTKDNVGIINLYVLKLSEDQYPDERYCGSLKSEDGIHVASPNILPENDEESEPL